MSMSQRAKDRLKKDVKGMIETTEKVYKNIKNKADTGRVLRDQEIRFIEHYPDLIKMMHERLADEKVEETLPPGKLAEYIEKLWALRDIGSLEQVVEATGYYRCDACGELHKVGEECIYIQYRVIKGIPVKEDIEGGRAGFSHQADAEDDYKEVDLDSKEIEDEDDNNNEE